MFLLVVSLSPCSASAGHLVIATRTRELWDYMPGSGQVTNPRPLNIPSNIAGMDTDSLGRMYLLTTISDSSLYRVNPQDGAVILIGPTGLGVVEGDLSFDPVSGILFGTSSADRLFTINTQTGTGTIVGAINADDVSGLAFDPAGNLWALASNTNTTDNADLLLLDKTNGAVLSRRASGVDTNSTVGMDFHGNQLIVAVFGGHVFSADTATGQFTAIDSISVSAHDIAWVPEPSALAIAATALLAALAKSTRRRRRYAALHAGIPRLRR